MGGRMSGESPREEKCAVRNCATVTARPRQTGTAGDTAADKVGAAQTSSQQLDDERDLLGQHDLCAAGEWSAAEAAQSDDIGEAFVKATNDP